eukprot:gene11256-15063_t
MLRRLPTGHGRLPLLHVAARSGSRMAAGLQQCDDPAGRTPGTPAGRGFRTPLSCGSGQAEGLQAPVQGPLAQPRALRQLLAGAALGLRKGPQAVVVDLTAACSLRSRHGHGRRNVQGGQRRVAGRSTQALRQILCAHDP